jgi:hypothetical protein
LGGEEEWNEIIPIIEALKRAVYVYRPSGVESIMLQNLSHDVERKVAGLIALSALLSPFL